MCFLVNLDDFFTVICTGFHGECGFQQIRYVRIISIIDGACTDYAEYVTIARPAGECEHDKSYVVVVLAS